MMSVNFRQYLDRCEQTREGDRGKMITYDFTEKVVVVTGGGRGIGKRIAQRFVQAGAHVVVCRKSPERLDELETELLSVWEGSPELAPTVHALSLIHI